MTGKGKIEKITDPVKRYKVHLGVSDKYKSADNCKTCIACRTSFC